jgi:hypothetical protein
MKLIISSILILFQIHASAQDSIYKKYLIIDSHTSQPILDGKMFILSNNDTINKIIFVNGIVSISYYDIIKFKPILVLLSPNYDTLKVHNVDTINNINKIDTLIMDLKYNSLKEVIVNSPILRQDIDKITYNISSDVENKKLNLYEVLNKVPFLSYSFDDNLLFKGNTNYLILLNGRRSNLFSNKTIKSVLKVIPANTILKIEIITDPPARYEIDGLVGIINIILIRNPDNGYNSTLNLSSGTFISNATGSMNYNKNKFGLILETGLDKERSLLSQYNTDLFSGLFSFIHKENKSNENISNHINMVLSYEIDTFNLITFSNGALSNKSINTIESIYEKNDYNNTKLSSYLFYNNQKSINKLYNYNINYQKNFKNNKERLLTFSFLTEKNVQKLESLGNILQSQNYHSSNRNQISEEVQSNKIIQIDYVQPFRKLKYETGFKYIYRFNSSEYITNINDNIFDTYIMDTSNSGNIHNQISIWTIYNSLVYKFDKISFKVGYRFESSFLRGLTNSIVNDLRINHYNFLPSFKLLYKSKFNYYLSISYKQQIQRPGITLLNPVFLISAPGFGNSGNPKLSPVILNDFIINYSSYRKASIDISLNYSFSRNTIQTNTRIIDDSIFLTSFENIGKYMRFGINNSIDIPMTSRLNISVNGSFNYVKINSLNNFSQISNQGIEGFIYSYLTLKIKDFRFTGNLGYYGPTVNIYAKSSSYFYSSLGISKHFNKDKAFFTFRVSNPFKKYRLQYTRMSNTDLLINSVQTSLFRGFSISFNYKFGKLSKEIKINKKSIQIDDAAIETGKIK